MTTLIDGKAVSDQLLANLKTQTQDLREKTGRQPGLAVILVGDNPASKAYVGRKTKTCQELGIRSFDHRLPDTVTESELTELIETLNQDDHVHGILLQLPLPSHLDSDQMLRLISPDKDVDGFHPTNVGKLLLGLPTFKSCTPYGVCQLLEAYNIDVSGQHVVIIGRSNIVGKPLAAMLVQKGQDATVTICHSRTQNLAQLAKQADILVAAIGRAHFVTADMVKKGAVVIDVGINRVEAPETDRGYKLVGDVDFEAVKEIAGAITPVPGGVGPMTIAMLMTNTLQSFEYAVAGSEVVGAPK